MKLGVAPLNSRIDGFGPSPVTGFMIIDSLLDWDMESLHSALSHIALPALTLALARKPARTPAARIGVAPMFVSATLASAIESPSTRTVAATATIDHAWATRLNFS